MNLHTVVTIFAICLLINIPSRHLRWSTGKQCTMKRTPTARPSHKIFLNNISSEFEMDKFDGPCNDVGFRKLRFTNYSKDLREISSILYEEVAWSEIIVMSGTRSSIYPYSLLRKQRKQLSIVFQDADQFPSFYLCNNNISYHTN